MDYQQQRFHNKDCPRKPLIIMSKCRLLLFGMDETGAFVKSCDHGEGNGGDEHQNGEELVVVGAGQAAGPIGVPDEEIDRACKQVSG